MAAGHGAVAATALVSLIVLAVRNGLSPMGKSALAAFLVAAVGGVYLFVNYQWTGALLPLPIVFVHGGLAVTGFGLLLAGLYERHMQRSR
jgi:hypothetical protein